MGMLAYAARSARPLSSRCRGGSVPCHPARRCRGIGKDGGAASAKLGEHLRRCHVLVDFRRSRNDVLVLGSSLPLPASPMPWPWPWPWRLQSLSPLHRLYRHRNQHRHSRSLGATSSIPRKGAPPSANVFFIAGMTLSASFLASTCPSSICVMSSIFCPCLLPPSSPSSSASSRPPKPFGALVAMGGAFFLPPRAIEKLAMASAKMSAHVQAASTVAALRVVATSHQETRLCRSPTRGAPALRSVSTAPTVDLRGSPRPSVVSMSFWRGGGRV